MLELEADVQGQYELNINRLEPIHDFDKPILSARDVLRSHFLIANHFYLEGYGIGGVGVKSPELLESAIYRQVTAYGGQRKWDSIFDVTATLMYGLIKNHPFYDANKRTAFLTALYQLYDSGYCPSVHESEFENLTVQVAENNLGRFRRFKDLQKRRIEDPEIHFISKWLRDNTRKVDQRNYQVTYRELKNILASFEVYLEDPHNNRIDVVRYISKRRGFGLLKPAEERVRLGRIGFPRWGAKVAHGEVKKVRELTGLSYKDGVDSAAFFRGVDPMQSLIATYNEPLIRLADR